MKNLAQKLVKNSLTTDQNREWLNLSKLKNIKTKLRIMSYNILAPTNIKKHYYPEQNFQELEKYSRYNLILKYFK
jgi:mRNA deadenylase 3'-5' endonuclease subunit Ccr4